MKNDNFSTFISITCYSSTLYNLSEKNKKEYIDKGYEETIVIIDNYGKTKEILIKKDSKLVDMLKKELEKDK